MKKIVCILIIGFAGLTPVKAQWPSSVILIPTSAGDSVVASGDIAKGKILEDLGWAAASSNACFPATQNQQFRGPHVFYATQLPPRSVLVVSLTPTDPSADLSLYGYMIGEREYRLVPDLPRCITCEADYARDRPFRGKAPSAERRIEFQNPGQNSYNILIGITAPEGVLSGAFRMKLKLKS